MAKLAPSQHLVRAEPGLRVVRVRIGAEARKRREGARRPFPHLAPMRSAARRARIPTPPRSAAGAAPTAIGLRLVPVTWRTGACGSSGSQRSKRRSCHVASLFASSAAPCRPLRRIQILAHSSPARRDAKRRDLHLVRPLLVVEDELLLARLGAEAECAARDVENSGTRPRRMRLRPRAVGIAERLAGVVERLGVHVLVQRGEAGEVAQALVVGLARDALEDALEDVRQVVARRRQRRAAAGPSACRARRRRSRRARRRSGRIDAPSAPPASSAGTSAPGTSRRGRFPTAAD